MQKLPEHKGVQVPSTEQLLEDGSVGKAVQYTISIPQMLSLQGFDTPKFLLFLNKIIESILRTSDLWQNMRGSQRSKTFRKCMKCTCNWNFQGRGEGES